MRSYPHSHFEGVSLSPSGEQLSLDYFDWDQGGTRLCFHYVFMLGSPLRLFTGYAHDDRQSECKIISSEIPSHVLDDAKTWLEAQLIVARSQEKTELCLELTEHLESLGELKL